MAMGPVEIAATQRMADVSPVKHQENVRPMQEQMNMQTEMAKEVQHLSEQVVSKAEMQMGNQRHDASEKGKNEYISGGRVRIKRKDGKEEELSPKESSIFDISI